MKRSFRVLGTAAIAAIGLLGSTSAAYADTMFDTGMVTVEAQTRAVRVDVGGIAIVSVNKVSDPGVQVRVTVAEGSSPVVSTVYAAGENNCSAEDNVAMGTLNRSITVQGGPWAWANIYVKAQFTTTTPIGVSTTHVLEPLGPAGMTVDGVILVTGVPVNICVA
ncbi:MAG TPA: hypothetical protein VFK43_21350 [Acidimicrobiales bacterium]|nr:hypothetical protein [Acidimicrobiales bacterium]